MSMMKAIQVAEKGGAMKLVEIPIPQPQEGQVLLRVEACGICHGDAKVIEGATSSYPRIPGHEVVGIVEKLGVGATRWGKLDSVSVSAGMVDTAHNCSYHRRRLCAVYGGLRGWVNSYSS